MATNVYYSICPFGTGNLLSGGSPTIVVDASGNATLTLGGASQVDNIGQGVCVEYNSIVSYIDSITDATHFHLVTALGANAASQSSTAVTSIHHAFASLSDAEAAMYGASYVNNNNLTTADVIINLPCYYDHDDDTPDGAVSFSGGTGDATRYVNVYVPTGGNQSIHNQRHSGVYASNVYRVESTDASAITHWDEYLRFDGIELLLTLTGSANMGGFFSIFIDVASDIRISNCLFKGVVSGTGACAAINMNDTELTVYIWNCIAYDLINGLDSGMVAFQFGGGTYSVYNCTAVNCYYGFNRGGTGTVNVYNSVAFDCTNNWNGTIGGDYNASSDADAQMPGGNSQTNVASTDFTNYDGDEFDISPTAAKLKDTGDGDSVSGLFSTDIARRSRPAISGDWDIGAFEYVLAGAKTLKIGGIENPNKVGAVLLSSISKVGGYEL